MKRVRQHQGCFYYQDRPVNYSFWSNVADGQKPDVVILLGAGQTGTVARMVAEHAGTGVVVIGGVPHWHADPSAADIKDFTTQYFESAFQEALHTFGCSSAHLLAESQAAPVAIILAGTLPEAKNLGLIRPLGFSVQAFGATTKARLKTFRKRIIRTWLQYPQSFIHDPRNLWISAVLVRAMLREASLTSLNNKYAAGISYDSSQDLQRAAHISHEAGNTITFILGEKDRMFPPAEIKATLKTLHIPHVRITVMPGVSHSYLAARASRKVLQSTLRAVRNT